MNKSVELLRVIKTFRGTKYDSLVEEAVVAYSGGNVKKLEETMVKFPTEVQLLESLLDKVKGKSVFMNLKRALGSKAQSVPDTIIGLSSLMTHAAIECKENREYKVLLPGIYEKLGKLITQV